MVDRRGNAFALQRESLAESNQSTSVVLSLLRPLLGSDCGYRSAFSVLFLLASSCMVQDGRLQTLTVELDAFSGRPNPTWELSTEEVDELAARLSDLPACDQAFVPPALGYRGFEIRNQNERADLPARLRILDGFVYVVGGERTLCFKDQKGIEHWLIDQAAAHGFEIPKRDR